MATAEVDRYLAELEEPKRSTLEVLRTSILEVLPEAEQCISYGMPAFKVAGKTVAGFAAFKHHLSYLPHSGSVLSTLAGDMAGYETSKGALRFAIDKPLPKPLVKKLITARIPNWALRNAPAGIVAQYSRLPECAGMSLEDAVGHQKAAG